ncbi:bactofilin family protein [Pararhodospirillum oryzae]|nr:polymer-forming cytoskeletal protein [Pararhodospirillum oryzae]
MATRPTPPSHKQPEVPRRVLDLAGPGARRSDSAADDGKRLVVGREIRVSGEISACDHLVVEGSVQANLNNADILEVAEGGEFKGSVNIGEAIISGRFEGEMIAQRRVVLHSTGEILGKVQTVALVVEEGGRLKGAVSPLEGSDAS